MNLGPFLVLALIPAAWLMRKLFKLSWLVAFAAAYAIGILLYWWQGSQVNAQGGTQTGFTDYLLWPMVAITGKALSGSTSPAVSTSVAAENAAVAAIYAKNNYIPGVTPNAIS